MDHTDNQAVLWGTAADIPTFSHSVRGVGFYQFTLCVPRLSGWEDRVNVMVSAPLLFDCPIEAGQNLAVSGEVRSFNNRSGIGNRLVISVLARNLTPGDNDPCNTVLLSGILCKPPILRRTPLGREICDFLLAVNRNYHRADYLPCIAWGSLAVFCAQCSVGDPISLHGRLQSRTYIKRTPESTTEHTAYEISVMSLDTITPV